MVNNGPAKASVVVVESRLSDKENDERYASDIRASLPMFGNDDSGSDHIFKMISVRMALRNFMVDMIKPYMLSTFREYTLVYRTDAKSGLRQVISPLNKMIRGYTYNQMDSIKEAFDKLCRRLELKFGEKIELFYYVNRHEALCRIYLLESKCEVTKRMINSESLQCFIAESSTGRDIQRFKHDMDLDTIDFYSYHDINNYTISHRGRNL